MRASRTAREPAARRTGSSRRRSRRPNRPASPPRSSRRAPPPAARGAAAPHARGRGRTRRSPIGSCVTSTLRTSMTPALGGWKRVSTSSETTRPVGSDLLGHPGRDRRRRRNRCRSSASPARCRRRSARGGVRPSATRDEHAQAVLLPAHLIGLVVDPVRGRARSGTTAATSSRYGTSRSTRGSGGSPSTRSPIIVRCTSFVPPPIVPENCSSNWSGHSSWSAPRGAEQRDAELRPLAPRLRPQHLHAPNRRSRAGPPARTDSCTRRFMYRRICSRACTPARAAAARSGRGVRSELTSDGGEGRVSRGRGVAAADHRRLVREHRPRRRPTAVDLADDVLDRHAHVGEEHLVEVRGARDLAQRTDLDAGRAQIEQEERDPAVLGRVGVRAGRAGSRSRTDARSTSTPSAR